MEKTKTLPYYVFEDSDWGQSLEARYWNPNGLNICIVASITKGIDWAAYIGACPGAGSENDALLYTAKWGCKLSAKDAKYFFPEITLPYRS